MTHHHHHHHHHQGTAALLSAPGVGSYSPRWLCMCCVVLRACAVCRYNPVQLFAAGGITPSDSSISTSTALSVLASSFGQASLQCSNGQLSGVGLCLDKTLAPMDCPSNVEQSCGDAFVFPAAAPYF